MKRHIRCLVAVGASLFAIAASVRSADAQVVQLPTVGVTSVATTVSVPDRGGVSLGGVGRSSSGSVSRGIGPGRLLGNRASGTETSAGGISAHATIINHDEIDAALLAEADHRRGIVGGRPAADFAASGLSDRAAYLTRNVARRQLDAAAPRALAAGGRKRAPAGSSAGSSAAAITAMEQGGETEVVFLFRQAEEARKAGKKGAARVYYQMAERRADGLLKLKIQDRLASLTDPSAVVRVATRER